jgi:hypothetical protein
MNFKRSLFTVLLVASAGCLLSTSAHSSSSSTEVSASIRASATVINPVGMTSMVREFETESDSNPALQNDNLHQKLADVLLIQTPPESLMFLTLEAEGKAVACFVLSEKSLNPDRMAGAGVWVSGGYLLNEKAIRAVLPADDSRCVLTLIDSGN